MIWERSALCRTAGRGTSGSETPRNSVTSLQEPPMSGLDFPNIRARVTVDPTGKHYSGNFVTVVYPGPGWPGARSRPARDVDRVQSVHNQNWGFAMLGRLLRVAVAAVAVSMLVPAAYAVEKNARVLAAAQAARAAELQLLAQVVNVDSGTGDV